MTTRYEQNREEGEARARLQIQGQTVAIASESAYAAANRAAQSGLPRDIYEAKVQAERLVAALTWLAKYEARYAGILARDIP